MLHPEQLSQAYLVRRFEMMVNAPRSAIWPFMLDFTSFNQTFEMVEVLDGKADTIGAVSRLTKMQGKWYMPPYLVKIIELIPQERIVWKMFPEEGDGFFGFVDFRIEDVGGSTRFTDLVYFEYRLPKMSPEKLREYEANVQRDYEILEEEIFFKLKTLAEGTTRR